MRRVFLHHLVYKQGAARAAGWLAYMLTCISLPAAHARRYYGLSRPLNRMACFFPLKPKSGHRFSDKFERKSSNRKPETLPVRCAVTHLRPAHPSQQAGRTQTPGRGIVTPTAQPAYLRESAIPRGFTQAPQSLPCLGETVSSPAPREGSDRGEYKRGRACGDKSGRKTDCLVNQILTSLRAPDRRAAIHLHPSELPFVIAIPSKAREKQSTRMLLACRTIDCFVGSASSQ
jgi:hypothetical protein